MDLLWELGTTGPSIEQSPLLRTFLSFASTMSPQDNPRRPEDKPDGLSKYIQRMKSVLRPRTGSKRQSVATMPEVAESSSAAYDTYPLLPPLPPIAHIPDDANRVELVHHSPPAPAPAPIRHSIGVPEPSMGTTDYSAVQQEKARALFAKYGLTLEPGEWQSPTDLQLTRVTKPIRMRVHRTCHRCQTTFGPDKVCVNCQHTRCKKCPRFPPAREKDEDHPRIQRHKIPEIRARQLGASSINPYQFRLTGDPLSPLKMPSRTGGPDLVHKAVRQRVRRSCHMCGTMYQPGNKQCESCNHIRCKRCPREPPKLDKYPDGYPGDVDPPKLLKPERTFKKARRRVHYICHVCNTGYNDGANTCVKCGQAKCEATIRIPYVPGMKREMDYTDSLQTEEDQTRTGPCGAAERGRKASGAAGDRIIHGMPVQSLAFDLLGIIWYLSILRRPEQNPK